MNLNVKNAVIITENDFNLLKPYANKKTDSTNEMSLANELSRAVIVKEEEFPADGIRLNSTVSLLDRDTNMTMKLIIVMPQYADMRQNKISILTPIGAALIGFRKAEFVEWKVPAGLKRFQILDVINQKTNK
ncbi:MAG: GreA/GreB family elongation factor [Bacteroidota bacterium]